MGVVAQTVGRVWNCAMAQRGPKNITPEHKAAMAAGRSEGRQIRNYLEALQDSKPKRGRRRTVESVTTRLSAIEDELTNADPMRRLSLVQERIDLSQELQRLEAEGLRPFARMGRVVHLHASAPPDGSRE